MRHFVIDDRQAFWRLMRVCGGCVFFACLFSYAPATRTQSLFALAAIFSAAAAYELSARGVSPRFMLLAVCLFFASAGALDYILDLHAPVRPDAQGPLLAASDPALPGACGPSGPSDLVMIFGTDRVIAQGDGPFTPVRIGSCPALTITRQRGGLTIDAHGFDSDDNVIWRIEKNQFGQVLRGFLAGHRPDASTLQVADNEGKETLFIRYRNRNALVIRGIFGCGDTQPVVIADGKVVTGGRLQDRRRCLIMRPHAAPMITYSSPEP